MNQHNVIDLKKPEPFINDQITTIIRQGDCKLLAQALEAEIELFIAQHAALTDLMGRQRIVRNGYLPQREIQSGIGPVTVRTPRVRDRHPIRPRHSATSMILSVSTVPNIPRPPSVFKKTSKCC
jgi:putative transposase